MGVHSPNIIANSLISCATYNGSGEVLIHGDRRITWSQLKSRVFKFAQALIRLGVKKDDKVAFMFHNTPEFVEINWGIHVAGGVPTPMNYRFVANEIEFQCTHSDAKVFLYDSLWAQAVEAAIPKLKTVSHFVCKGGSTLGNVIDYDAFVDSGQDIDPCVPTDWDDTMVMVYTGGTTGFPKGVMLTYQAHRELYAVMFTNVAIRSLTADISAERHKLMMEAMPIPGKRLLGPLMRTRVFKKFIARPRTRDKLHQLFDEMFSKPEKARRGYKQTVRSMLPSMPFFHDAGYSNLSICGFSGNLCFVLPDSTRLDPALVFSLIEKEQVRNLSNVPTGWKKLVSSPDRDKYDLGSIRLTMTGGGVCTTKLKKEILELFPGAMILDAFGQTEMTPITSFKMDFDPDNIVDRSVGQSIVEAKIVDVEGKEMPRGETGEILYRSSTVMKGYYKDEEKTKEVLEDGWFRSGDLGYFDESGEIRVVDRIKECINTGGEKVFPLEVEEIIQNHPDVADVCVIGVPDEEWGNTIRAVVQLREGGTVEAQEIMDFCRDKLAGYKIPRSVVFTEALPFSPAGKLLRQKVRDAYI